MGFLLCIYMYVYVCIMCTKSIIWHEYAMVVESPEGGIDIYSEADPQSTKLNGELIPNGIAIRIQEKIRNIQVKIGIAAGNLE